MDHYAGASVEVMAIIINNNSYKTPQNISYRPLYEIFCLYEVFRWVSILKNHQSKCRRISLIARKFARIFFTPQLPNQNCSRTFNDKSPRCHTDAAATPR